MYKYKDKIFCVMTCMRPIEQRAFVFPAALVMLMCPFVIVANSMFLGETQAIRMAGRKFLCFRKIMHIFVCYEPQNFHHKRP